MRSVSPAPGCRFANALSSPDEFPVINGQRRSIHDVTIDDINPTAYNSTGRFAEVMTQAPNPLLQNLFINHATAFATNLLSVSGATNPAMPNFTLTNSILSVGIYPVWSATGSSTDCAAS